jgi:fructosamine-3-kinase
VTLPAELGRAIEELTGRRIHGSRAVGGGSINDAWRIESEAGPLFVKARARAGAGEFRMEAAGLEWLAAGEAPVPRVVAVGEDPPLLALEWIEPEALTDAGAEELGRRLAALHRSGADAYGELPPRAPDRVLRLGSVRVELDPATSWPELYGGRLLLPLTARAFDSGALDREQAAAVESLCERLTAVAGPAEPPARLHGDLWGGNILAGAGGTVRLVDPAAYGGHREVDLAMLRLFGAPSGRILAAYQEAFPLADGHRERVKLWQVLPLLVHAILFGGGYGAAAARAAISST